MAVGASWPGFCGVVAVGFQFLVMVFLPLVCI